MWYKPAQLRKILGITKSFHTSLLTRNILICSNPSRIRGTGNKYTREDVLKNLVLVELFQCGLRQKNAHALINKVDLEQKMFIVNFGEIATLTINLEILSTYLQNYDESIRNIKSTLK